MPVIFDDINAQMIGQSTTDHQPDGVVCPRLVSLGAHRCGQDRAPDGMRGLGKRTGDVTWGPENAPTAVSTVKLMSPADRSLNDAEVSALCEALEDEYMAIATYDQVIADFGSVRPFVNIVEAEHRHAEALLTLFERFDVAIPHNPWPDQVERFPSLHDACVAGVEGEIENGAMYDRLIGATRQPDIIEVFRNLQRASQERHLDAFRRCVNRHEDAVGNSTAGHRRRRRDRGGRA